MTRTSRTRDRNAEYADPWPSSIRARALLLVGVPSLVLLGLMLAFWAAQRREVSAQAWSLHTKDVLEASQELLTHLLDAQTGIRGYLIAQDRSFLDPYTRATQRLPITLERLRTLTADNPQQLARARAFDARARTILAHYEDALTTAISPAEATRIVRRGRGLMDALREDVRVFRQEEHRLDAERRDTLARAERRLFTVVTGGTGIALFAVIALGASFQRSLERRVGHLTRTARLLTEGGDAGPAGVEDELAVVDRALRDLAQTLSQQQRAAVAALGDAVRLFSAAGDSRAVLDVAVDRALALSGASLALCVLETDPHAAQTVTAAAATSTHPSAAPAPGTTLTWTGGTEVVTTGRARQLTHAERLAAAIPNDVERVFGGGVWLGVPIIDDRHAPVGVLQVVMPEGRAIRDEERDIVVTLAQAASVALALERSRQQLEALNADLALTNRENELFIYSVSHDLRSPLVNLEGFSRELTSATATLQRLLQATDVPEHVRAQALPLIEQDMHESVRFIRTAVARLAAIIDGLLRLSRAGRVEYRLQPVSLQATVTRVLDAMHASLTAAGADVRVGPLPQVTGDALAIEQIFANLIGNAVAYARPDVPPRIEVATEDDLTHGPAFTVVRVTDNGLGIPEAHHEKIFQPLQRVHTNVAGGEGIGLAIVRRIVERHGGRIWVRSRVNAGSTFYVELPRVAGEVMPHAS